VSSAKNTARSSALNVNGLMNFLRQPVDASSVILFRVAFGVVLAAWAWNYLSSGRVTRLYIEPKFHFPYGGFEWVQPLPGNWMYAPFVVLLVLALLIATGLFYRLATILFAIGITYVFLLERTNYQNHYYLVCLVAWTLTLLPLNRLVAGDVWRGAVPEQHYVSRWVLLILQFHIAVPYFYGGVAKITPDWLLGQPMGIYLESKSNWPFIGSWLASSWAGVLFSYGGLLFDLAIVPLLIWKRTRMLAFFAAVLFHLSNAILFSIHIFPWFMILATTLFFSPDWVRRLLASGRPKSTKEHSLLTNAPSQNKRETILIYGFACYVVFHLFWPLRCQLYHEETSWTERAHLFSWRMMLRAKEVGLGFAIRDPETGTVTNVNHAQYLDPEQAEKFGRDPHNILSFARFIARTNRSASGKTPEVYAFVAASLNGRKPQLMVDPNVNLAGLTNQEIREGKWIMPLVEPLRFPAWNLPPSQWREHMELPEIKFLKPSNANTNQSS
jgi:vitamin K-dependent gamma-carboxylase